MSNEAAIRNDGMVNIPISICDNFDYLHREIFDVHFAVGNGPWQVVQNRPDERDAVREAMQYRGPQGNIRGVFRREAFDFFVPTTNADSTIHVRFKVKNTEDSVNEVTCQLNTNGIKDNLGFFIEQESLRQTADSEWFATECRKLYVYGNYQETNKLTDSIGYRFNRGDGGSEFFSKLSLTDLPYINENNLFRTMWLDTRSFHGYALFPHSGRRNPFLIIGENPTNYCTDISDLRTKKLGLQIGEEDGKPTVTKVELDNFDMFDTRNAQPSFVPPEIHLSNLPVEPFVNPIMVDEQNLRQTTSPNQPTVENNLDSQLSEINASLDNLSTKVNNSEAVNPDPVSIKFLQVILGVILKIVKLLEKVVEKIFGRSEKTQSDTNEQPKAESPVIEPLNQPTQPNPQNIAEVKEETNPIPKMQKDESEIVPE